MLKQDVGGFVIAKDPSAAMNMKNRTLAILPLLVCLASSGVDESARNVPPSFTGGYVYIESRVQICWRRKCSSPFEPLEAVVRSPNL
jgi:hypothetical protein